MLTPHEQQAARKATRQPKFRLGQVVCMRSNNLQIGRISEFLWTGKIMLEFWDFDNSDRWTWDYAPKDLRPLTARESGVPRERERIFRRAKEGGK